jgi:hypothetical protein
MTDDGVPLEADESPAKDIIAIRISRHVSPWPRDNYECQDTMGPGVIFTYQSIDLERWRLPEMDYRLGKASKLGTKRAGAVVDGEASSRTAQTVPCIVEIPYRLSINRNDFVSA